jgi:hypothetical protein
MCRVSARRLSIYNFVWGLEGQSIFNTSKLKKKIHMGSIRQSLQAQPKTYKSYRNTKSTNRNKKKSQKKSMFSTSKVKRRQKFVWGLPS